VIPARCKYRVKNNEQITVIIILPRARFLAKIIIDIIVDENNFENKKDDAEM